MMTTAAGAPALTAYHGDAALKAAIIAELEDHVAHDRLVKGQYWERGKGCAVGCTIKSNNHAEYEPRFGIPIMLARLEDAIFESLPNVDAMAWPIRFMAAAPVDADLSLIGWQFLDRMLRRAFGRIKARDQIHADCAPTLAVIARMARGEAVTKTNAASAISAAEIAWEAAATRPDRAAPATAMIALSSAQSAAAIKRHPAASAWSAASSSSWSGSSAADCVTGSANKKAAHAAEYRQQADDLCELMALAPVANRAGA